MPSRKWYVRYLQWVTSFVALFVLLDGQPVVAHSGPPFPILIDHIAGQYKVSVWSDPDIGIGTFYVVLESTGNNVPAPPGKVEITVQPMTRRLPENSYAANLQSNRNTINYFVEVPFDKQDKWRVRVLLHSAGNVEEIVTQVESTPDDLGVSGLLLYSLPFVAVGFLWVKASLKGRQKRGGHTD